MTDDPWQHVKEIFAAALERSAAKRSAYLDEACHGDPDLRAQVDDLLASYHPDTGFLEPPPGHPAARLVADVANRAEEGQRVGRYQLVELIASGGMGRVYRAQCDDGAADTQFAVKLMKRGMDTDELVRRFQKERQTLASLDHPNIARLLDGGATPDGRPYLVMEYVDGRTIDRYCDDQRLSVHDRLGLFHQACGAVQHAHHNHVVHRDLKPGNILVTDDGKPKLLDFGIAKILDDDAGTHPATTTVSTLRIMTPQYASPEQILGEPITTASDVYSLGVVLYELVTGHSPYTTIDRGRRSVERSVCEEQPEKPSTVITRTTNRMLQDGSARTVTPASLSNARDTDPARLRRRLRGDLDAIVLKSLKKDPRQRYESVDQFAEDLARYLAGQPTRARETSLTYRARRFIRQHKVLAAASVAAVLALIVGTSNQAFRNHSTDNNPSLAIAVSGFTTPAAWATFDPGVHGVGRDPDGYMGAVFDGRYVYFAPGNNGKRPHGEVVRCDTTAEFGSASAWTTFTPADHGVGGSAIGYAGAIYDGRFVYFTPSSASFGFHGEVLRYDTGQPFDHVESWSAYDPGDHGVGENPVGYVGGTFDGRYIYFAPHRNAYDRTHAEVLRYDTMSEFTHAVSWTTFDPRDHRLGRDPGGFANPVFDGQFVYFVPLGMEDQRPSEVLRYDTRREFSDASSWTTFDFTREGLVAEPTGYRAIFHERFVYFVPGSCEAESHGGLLRFDTSRAFTDPASWTFHVPSEHEIGHDSFGFGGIVCDGRFVYCVPCKRRERFHGEVLRYDTMGAFGAATSWATFDAGDHGIGVDPDGYIGGVFDGRFVYFSPYYNGSKMHGEVLRYDTAFGLMPEPDEPDIAVGIGDDRKADDGATPNTGTDTPEGFTNVMARAAFDAGDHGVGGDPDGYAGAVSDGRFLYFVPSNNGSTSHGEVLRYDTTANTATRDRQSRNAR